jgi:hypothetical protein
VNEIDNTGIIAGLLSLAAINIAHDVHKDNPTMLYYPGNGERKTNIKTTEATK